MSYAPMDLRGASLALLVSLLWGVNPIAIKLGLDDTGPLHLAAYRFIISVIVLAAWAWRTGRLDAFRLSRQERRPLIVLGLMMTVQISSMNVATAMTSASHVAIILNSYAVHIAVLAHFMIPGDRLSPRRLAGTLVAYAGIVSLFAGGAATGGASLVGDLIVLGSALILGERTVYMAQAVQKFDPLKMLLSQALIGIAGFWLLSLVFEPEPTRWTTQLVGTVVFQGLIVSGFNFAVNLWLLKRYRPSTVSTFFLTQPIFGVFAAALVTGDQLTPTLLFASAAVAAGIGLASK